jgi:hypothetical protein
MDGLPDTPNQLAPSTYRGDENRCMHSICVVRRPVLAPGNHQVASGNAVYFRTPAEKRIQPFQRIEN